MKRIIALIIAICFMLPTNIVLAEVPKDEADCQAVIILKGLHLIDDGFKSDKYLTRAEFVNLAVLTLSKTTNGGGEVPFVDVLPSDKYYGAISIAYSLGLISSAEFFEPNANVTFEQAAKILVHMLGYEHTAKLGGGYTGGYVKIANSLYLFDNVKYTPEGFVSGAQGATIIRNAMESKYMKIHSDGVREESENLYMNDYLDIYKGRGIVTSDGRIDFENGIFDSKVLKINGESMVGDFDLSSLLGEEVIYYYRQSSSLDEKTILYAEATSKNTVYEVLADDISDKTTTKQFVYEKKHSEEYKNIADDVTIIYNGKAIFAYKREHLMPSVGTVRLVDNNGDRKIDVIISNSYNVAVVNSYNQATQSLILKYRQPAKKLDNTKLLSIIKAGKEISPSELKEWDVINYYENEDELCMVVSEGSASGTINTIVDSDDLTIVSIENTEYEVSRQFIVESGALKPGERGVFGFDITGKIVFADYSTTGKRNYSILLYASLNTDDEERVVLKFFNSKGKIDNAICSKKIKINDRIYEGIEAVNKLKTEGLYQLIVTDSNLDGEICEVDLAKDYSNDLTYVGYNDDEFSLDKKINSTRFYQGWGAGCYLPSDIVIFSIPTNKEAFDLYKAEGQSKIGLDDITIENFCFYDLDRFNFPRVMVINDFDIDGGSDTVNVNLYDEWFLVSDIYKAINADGEVRTKLCGYSKSIYKEFWIAESGASNVTNFMVPNEQRMGNPVPNNDRTMWGFIGHTYMDIKKGDIMQLGYNSKDEINAYRMLWSSKLCGADIHTYLDGTFGGYDLIFASPGDYYEINENDGMQANNPNFMSMCYTGFGEIIDVNGKFVRYKTNCPLKVGDNVERYPVERVQQILGSVYVIELNGKRVDVKKGSDSDLTIGDMLFIHVRDNRSFYCAIIRDNR